MRGEARAATPSGRAFRTLTAALWLAHPASLVAIAVLLVNDHVLKAQFGTWWTGKLSDVAGLAFAPALAALVITALVPRASPRTVAVVAIALTGVTFASVKGTAAGADAASAAWSALTGPGVILQDATDLLTLPALGIAWLAFRATERRATQPGLARRAVATIAIPIAAAAVMATDGPSYHEATGATTSGNLAVVSVYAMIDGIPDGTSAYVTQDGFRWTASGGGGGTATEACVPDEPNTCYRIVPGRIGVESSADGGETWQWEWGLTVPEQRRLWQRWRASEFTLDRYESEGIAIASGPGWHTVYVANGLDGVAARDRDGEWRRIGFQGLVEKPFPSYPLEAPDIPSEPGPVAPGAIGAAVAWWIAAAMLGRLVIVTALAYRAPTVRAWKLHWILVGLAVAAATAGGWACAAAARWANDNSTFWLMGPALIVAAIFRVSGCLVATWPAVEGTLKIGTYTGRLGFVSGLAAAAALSVWPEAWFALFIWALVAGVLIARRLQFIADARASIGGQTVKGRGVDGRGLEGNSTPGKTVEGDPLVAAYHVRYAVAARAWVKAGRWNPLPASVKRAVHEGRRWPHMVALGLVAAGYLAMVAFSIWFLVLVPIGFLFELLLQSAFHSQRTEP